MKRFNRVLTLDERLARGALDFSNDPGLTEQSHRDSCDINILMATYDKTGVVPVMSSQVPTYGDFSGAVDYHTSQLLLIEANESFMQLPAKIRQQYDHDPAKFLAALENPDERSRLVELGVFVEETPSKQATVDVASQTPEGGQAA
jgi:phage internal scaffolding protein